MPGTRPRFLLLVAPALLLIALHAGAEDPRPRRGPPFPPLAAEQERAYGNRADFFRGMPVELRPDLDWRTAVSDALAEAEPRWSQGFEELIIRDFFGDRADGFYVDVGCYLPQKNSTTYYLEERLGWTGIGIDVMARFRKPWKQVRPRSTFVRAAVSDTDGEKLTLYIGGPFVSLEKDGLEALGLAHSARSVEVVTSTLDTLLDRQGVEKVDFLSMDIEGAELAGLDGFEIRRFRPDLCCVETLHPEAVTTWFAAQGYERIEKYRKADKVNLYFRPVSGTFDKDGATD